MDEINEKAIKEIIDYYDSLNDVHEIEEDTEEMETEVPALVDIVKEVQEQKEEKETSETGADNIPEEETEKAEETPEEKSEETEELTEQGETQTEEKDEQEGAQAEEEAETADDIGDEEDALAEKLNEEEPSKEDIISISKISDKKENDDKYSLNKKSKRLIAALTLLAMALVVMFVTIDSGFIGAYKRNASKNISIILNWFGIDTSRAGTSVNKSSNDKKYKSSVKNTVTVPMESAGQSAFVGFKGGIVRAYTNYMALIGSDGSTVWENTTSIVNPILKTSGNYILIAEKGGKKICLYNDSRFVYEADTEDNILNCSISSNGDVVTVTDKPSYKGAVVVFNRDGNQVFAWSSGSDNIVSADISAASRRVAMSLLNTDDKVRSTVQFFDMNAKESYAQVIFEDTIIFNVEFHGDTLSAFGDNGIAGIRSNGELVYDKRFDDVEFVHYGTDEEGNKILLFDNTNIPLINIYNNSGTLKNQISPEELPDFVDISGKYIVYNNGRNIIYGKAGKIRFEKYTASMDIKDLMLIDDNTFVIVYSNNIEIVKV